MWRRALNGIQSPPTPSPGAGTSLLVGGEERALLGLWLLPDFKLSFPMTVCLISLQTVNLKMLCVLSDRKHAMFMLIITFQMHYGSTES